mmetsp:Transcript_77328/g.145847  ORF Transcript_77328/g.145847 Transcript_77328/m.145847 type:complete len:495 (-) Transcript_77328:94-1578(-)
MPFNHLLRRLSLISSCFVALPAFVGAGGPFEIEFEPMGMDIGDSSADSLFDMMAKPIGPPSQEGEFVISSARPSMRGPSKHGREAEMDQMLTNMLGSMLGVPPKGRPHGLPMSTHGRGTPYGEVVIEGPTGTEVMSLGGGPEDLLNEDVRNKIPGDLFRELFPGPLGMMSVQAPHPQPFSAPDAFVMDMMQDLDRSFARDMMPSIHKAASQERTPNSCEQDIKTKCQGARSHLHCLGYNHDSISETCRKDVEKSVPFLCSQAIDKWCDVLEQGILSCLYGHMDSLDGKCRDAVLTTKKVINKVNTQKAAMVDPETGEKQMSIPEAKAEIDKMLDSRMPKFLALHGPEAKSSQAANPTQREAHLDAKLGIAPAAQPKLPAAAAAPAAQAKAAETATAQKATAAPGAAVVRNATAASFLSQPAPSSWSRSSALHLIRWPLLVVGFMCMIGVAAYTFNLQDSTLMSKAVRTALVQQQAPEGIKLFNNNVELPRSVDH